MPLVFVAHQLLMTESKPDQKKLFQRALSPNIEQAMINLCLADSKGLSKMTKIVEIWNNYGIFR